MLSLGFGYFANLIDFIPSPILGLAKYIVTPKKTIFNTFLNYIATWYSESGKRRGEIITLLAKSTHPVRTDERASMGNRDI